MFRFVEGVDIEICGRRLCLDLCNASVVGFVEGVGG